ncbi:MAG: tetratricopeptide repeat protein [Bacteroidetes bacterium]|nr:tetratricopeptide repeat protein [Bacteroidota bacterium]
MKFIISFAFILGTFITQAQTSAPFADVDALLGTGSMIDAMTALRQLKENHLQDTGNAEYWLRYSKASYIFYKYDDAKWAIQKAISLSPKQGKYYYEKGLLYNRINELDTALSALEKATGLEKNGEYYYWKGIVNQQLRRDSAARADYEKTLALKFETAELYNNLSILLSDEGRYKEALDRINSAIRLNTAYGPAYSARARICFFLIQVDSTCADRNRALAMGYKKTFNLPDSICSGPQKQKIQYATEILATNKFYEPAITGFNKLIEMPDPKSDYYLNRGYCYYQLKDYKHAEEDYMQALTYPDAAKDLLYDNLSLLYFDQNNFVKSLEYTNKRIDLDPKNHVAYLDRGLCYRKMKQYKEAEADYNKSLELKPDFFRAFGYRSFLYLELGQYQKSFDDASKSVEINPKYDYGYLVLAQAKQKLGMTDYCIDLFKAKQNGSHEADAAIMEMCK